MNANPPSHAAWPEPDIKTPVLIVGAGPSGLTLSLTLSRHAVPHVLVSRHPGTAHTPRAHIINQRTMEIMRVLGLEKAVSALNTVRAVMPQADMLDTCWITSMAAPEVLRMASWGNGDLHAAAYQQASPSRMCNIPQHLLEPVLLQAAHESPYSTICMNHEFTHLSQDDQGVAASVLNRVTGQELKIHCDYLVGADGGRSKVAELVALPFEGQSELADIAYAWIEADLTRYVAHRPCLIYGAAAPDFGGTFVNTQPWNEWVFAWRIAPHRTLTEKDHPEILSRVHEAIGDRTVPVTIKNISCWKINRLYAKQYIQGRVLCMGDAVHRHPPPNGLGLNTGVADAFNLGWKLKYVLDGKAHPSLLTTYDSERQPVGRQVVERAFQSLLQLSQLSECLELKPGQSPREHAQALTQLHEASPEGTEKRQRMDTLRQLLDQNFNAHGVELGYRYRRGARIDTGEPEPQATSHPDLVYQPTTWPGARVPHAWLQQGHHLISTLDLCGTSFSLIAGPYADTWRQAAAQAQAQTGVCIDVLGIDAAHSQLRDLYATWRQLREVEDDGAVLIRPDQHVAWRSSNAAGAAQLPAVMEQILGLKR